MDTQMAMALKSVRRLEKIFAQEAATSDINLHGCRIMFGNTVQKFSLHDLPPQAYVPFYILNYVATGGLKRELKRLIHVASVPAVPLPLQVRVELQKHQIVFGADVLHTLMQRGIECWPRNVRAEVFDYIMHSTPVANLESPYQACRDEVLKEVDRMNGNRANLRKVLHFSDGAAIIVGTIAPDAYMGENGFNWGAGI